MHRDFSIGNIIIADGFAGAALPDSCTYISGWATAEQVTPDRRSCRTNELTGIYAFMDLSVLDGEPHTISSDLESLAMIILFLACDLRPPWATSRTPAEMLAHRRAHLLLSCGWRTLCREYMQPSRAADVLKGAAQRLHALFWGSAHDDDRYKQDITPQQFLAALELPNAE